MNDSPKTNNRRETFTLSVSLYVRKLKKVLNEK